MSIGGQHCLILTPCLQRQKYSYFPTVLWDVSTAAVSRSKDEQVHFPISREYTPQPLDVLPTQFGIQPTQNRLILKFLLCLCCLMGLSGLGQEQLIKGSSCVIYPLQVGWWVATGGGSLLFLCSQAVATEREVLTFPSILLHPQVIFPSIKASSSHANNTALPCSGKKLINLIWWYFSWCKYFHVSPEGQILLLLSNYFQNNF